MRKPESSGVATKPWPSKPTGRDGIAERGCQWLRPGAGRDDDAIDDALPAIRADQGRALTQRDVADLRLLEDGATFQRRLEQGKGELMRVADMSGVGVKGGADKGALEGRFELAQFVCADHLDLDPEDGLSLRDLARR